MDTRSDKYNSIAISRDRILKEEKDAYCCVEVAIETGQKPEKTGAVISSGCRPCQLNKNVMIVLCREAVLKT